MIGYTNYPTALDTATELIRVANQAKTTLTAPVGPDDETLPVASTATFPPDGTVSLGSAGEIAIYAAKTATAFTGCRRGRFPEDGATPAAALPTGARAELLINAGQHRVLVDAILAIERRLGAGPNPAQSGHVRASNGAWISARDALNTRDLGLIRADTGDRVALADGAVLIDPDGVLRPLAGFRLPPERFAYVVDDFLSGSIDSGNVGDLGWSLVGFFTVSPASAGHPGVVTLSTAATAGALARLHLPGAGAVSGGDRFDVTWIVRAANIDTNTVIRVGLSSDWASGLPAAGAYFEKLQTSSSWVGVCRAGGVGAASDALAPVAAEWVKLRARRVDAATVAFSVDGGPEALVAQRTPGGAVSPGIHVATAVAAGKTINVDYFDMLVGGLAR